MVWTPSAKGPGTATVLLQYGFGLDAAIRSAAADALHLVWFGHWHAQGLARAVVLLHAVWFGHNSTLKVWHGGRCFCIQYGLDIAQLKTWHGSASACGMVEQRTQGLAQQQCFCMRYGLDTWHAKGLAAAVLHAEWFGSGTLRSVRRGGASAGMVGTQ
jgi:hypothetical protein